MSTTYSWNLVPFVASTVSTDTDYAAFSLNAPLLFVLVKNTSLSTASLRLEISPDKGTSWYIIKAVTLAGTATQVIDTEELASVSGAVGISSLFRFSLSANATLDIYFNAFRY